MLLQEIQAKHEQYYPLQSATKLSLIKARTSIKASLFLNTKAKIACMILWY